MSTQLLAKANARIEAARKLLKNPRTEHHLVLAEKLLLVVARDLVALRERRMAFKRTERRPNVNPNKLALMLAQHNARIASMGGVHANLVKYVGPPSPYRSPSPRTPNARFNSPVRRR